MKRTVKVTNVGKRIRERLGSRFLPNETQEWKVNSREYLTLKAVKDFNVEIIEDEQDNNSNIDTDNNVNDDSNSDDNENDVENDAEDSQDDEKLNYHDLNIEEVIKAVQEGVFEIDEAIAYEVAGKNRVTLLDQLEEMKQGE